MKLINLDDGVTVASLAKVREKAEPNGESESADTEITDNIEESFVQEEDLQNTEDPDED